jgi:nucleoside-diphosphate-sugar epimerase
MRVLVTGSEGYIGSVLGPFLAAHGHDVAGVDAGFYRSGWLYEPQTSTIPTLTRDIRSLAEADLDGFDAVVHMAELSNDPLGQLAPTITYDINHAGSVHVATAARAAGVERFVYTSSCSVYGDADEEVVDEQSPLRPQTAYAECKQLVERDVAALATAQFSPVFLRNATVYGASPRMRFDIVLNNLCGFAWTTRQIRMESDGTPWRPLVHVLDVCRAIRCALEAPREDVHGQVLNVGDRDANFQIREIAEIVGRIFPDCEVTVGRRGSDQRSYRVSFAKIHDLLPSFGCDWTPERGARQLLEIFRAVELTEEDFRSRMFTRLKQVEYLLRTGQIAEDFSWKPLAVAPPAARAR